MYRIGNAPTSWGVERPDGPGNPPWSRFLDEAAAAGYAGVELGPLGYLPTDPGVLAAALASRNLDLTAGYVLDKFWSRSDHDEIVAQARRVCSLLQSQGARNLVLISAIVEERTRTAGRSDAARRLDAAEAAQFAATIGELTQIAADHGLVAGLHPHAGTHLEFEDEIDRVLDSEQAADCGLVIDTGHLTYAGIDPVRFTAERAGRVRYVHVKDIDAAVLARMLAAGADFWEAYAAGVFCVLGTGVVDFAAFRDALAGGGYDGWLTVEQDADPGGQSVPIDDARRSLAFLRDQGLAR